MSHRETMGERLKRLREAKGLTQAALAKAAGYRSQGAIGNIETNDRGYGDAVVLIAIELGVSPEYLMMLTDDPARGSHVSRPSPPAEARSHQPAEVVAARPWPLDAALYDRLVALSPRWRGYVEGRLETAIELAEDRSGKEAAV